MISVWTFTLFITFCCVVWYYFKRKLEYFKDLGIPYVPGWPVIGNFPLPRYNKKPLFEVMQEIYNIHPEAKYVGMMEFMLPVIMIRDPELIKNITIKHFDSFVNHHVFLDVSIDPLFGGNLFSLQDDKWREARAMLSPAFTSSKMKTMHDLITGCAKNLVTYLNELPDSEKKMIHTKDLFCKYANDSVASCGFGLSVNSLKDPTNEFFIMGKQAADLEIFMNFKTLIALIFPSIAKLINFKFFNNQVAEFFTNIVRNTVEERDRKGESRPDMIQLMMNARGRENSNLILGFTEMTAQALVFFFGGFESTSTQMCIIAHELAINPDIQRRLQDEIDEVMEQCNDNPTYEAINNMAYLDAVFNESMRLHSINPVMDRICNKAFELPPALPGGKPFLLKPGMKINYPICGIHRDSKYYENPDKFDPDRYFQKKVSMNDATNLGFGIGPRSCLGNRFAILETKILFTLLLRNFNLVANEKTCIPFQYDHGFILKPKGGFWLALEKRVNK